MKNFIILLSSIVVLTVIVSISGSLRKEIVTAKVIETVSQMKIEEKQTNYRYLVITDKGTFICDSSWLNGKFNNSDEFYRIKKDSTYTFTVCGWGKTFLTDYKNILEVN